MDNLVNNIEIDEKIYDPGMDLYIVFAHSVKKCAEPYHIFWQYRENHKITMQGSYKDVLDAREHFNAVVKSEIEPNIEYRDPYVKNVYAWEDNDLTDYFRPLNKKEVKELIQKVSEDYKFDPPSIKHTKTGNYYYHETNHIELKDMNNITLLHELSHALTQHQSEQTERPYIDHSPQFVWNAIELYHQYADINLQYLVTTAAQHNILGDTQAKQIWDFDIEP